MRAASTILCLCLALAGLATAPARAQTSLGSQRVGTSSATFLKIGIDARGAALGGAYTALVEGPFAAFTNPAGLAKMTRVKAAFGYALWPADIDVFAFAFARPIGDAGATFAVSVQYVGTTLDETTEYHPQGTGRSFGYNDVLLGFSAARPFSDRLSIGGTIKFFREDLGSDIGGPTTEGWLVDAGSDYLIGFMDSRLSIGLLHFGPDLQPDGSFYSNIQQDDVDYTAFSPPTTFRIGLSFQAYTRGEHKIRSATEVVHVSDNRESLRGGIEYVYRERYALRTGYDGGADAAKFSAGLGIEFPWAGSAMKIDYAYTDGGPLLAIHRWAIVLPL